MIQLLARRSLSEEPANAVSSNASVGCNGTHVTAPNRLHESIEDFLSAVPSRGEVLCETGYLVANRHF
jgi:hypothetical protein